MGGIKKWLTLSGFWWLFQAILLAQSTVKIRVKDAVSREPLVKGGFLNPVFTPLWGPVEGRVLNLAVKISI